MSQTIHRFVALDVHKSYVVVGALDTRQEVVLHPRRVSLLQLDGWAKKHLKPTDAIVLEATSNAWYIHDLLEPLVARVMVANPYLVKLIAASFVKTDKRDTLVLARLLQANIIPEVWVPPPHVRELRALVSHRRRLVSQRTAAKNRLWSVLMRHNIMPPAGQVFSTTHRDFWERLPISSSEELRTRQDVAIIDHLSPLIEEVDKELARLSAEETWAPQAAFLVQLPGMGLLTAMTLLGAIGDITRFASAKKLVGYSGMGSRVYDSGQTHRTGRITKQGRREVRSVMIEAAWVAVRRHPFWKAKFERLEDRIGKQKAIVAIARKLLVVVWHVLTAQVADRQADPRAVACSLMTWATRYGLATSLGMPRAAFVCRELDRLGIGQAMNQFQYNGYDYHFPLPMAATVTEQEAAAGG